jgi:hypothetical protein
MNYLIPAAAASCLGYVGYRYAEAWFYSYVMNRVKDEMDKKMKKEDDEEMFRPGERSAVVRVSSGGKSHSIFLPYDRSKSSSMLRKKVFLIKNGEKIDISQQPGIPYLVSAEHLHGTEIVVENLSGDVLKSFSGNEIPGYI